MALTPPRLQDLLSAVQVEATLYNMFLNSTKTEILANPRHPLPQTTFANGDLVPVAEAVKYLGAKVTWENPTKAAIKDRQQKGHIAYCKLQHMWRSRLCWKAKVRLFHSYIVPVLVYSLSTLTLEEKHFASIDGWYSKYLRRCMGIKASYYSHIPNKAVWIKAGRPTLPSQTLLTQQLDKLVDSIQKPSTDPSTTLSSVLATKTE